MPIWSLSKKEKMLTQLNDSIYKCIEHWDYLTKTKADFVMVEGIPMYYVRTDGSIMNVFSLYYGSEYIEFLIYKNNFNVEVHVNGNFVLGISDEYKNSVLLKSKKGEKIYAERDAFNEIDFFQYTCGDAYIPLETNIMCMVKDKLLEIESDISRYY